MWQKILGDANGLECLKFLLVAVLVFFDEVEVLLGGRKAFVANEPGYSNEAYPVCEVVGDECVTEIIYFRIRYSRLLKCAVDRCADIADKERISSFCNKKGIVVCFGANF